MATSLGKLNVQVGADPSGLTAGFDMAKKAVQGFGSTLPAMLKSGLGALAGMGASIADSLGKAFTDPVGFVADAIGGIGNLFKGIPLLGPLLALPFEGLAGGIGFLLGTYQDGKDAIKEMGAQAMKTGIELSQFQLLSQVIGGGELAEKAIFKFQQKLAEAQLGAVGAKTAFDALGMDGKALADIASTDMVAAFSMVADKIKGMGNANLQAHAAFQLFGKSGFQMMPALLKGSEWIEKNRGWMDQFGMGFSSADFASIKAADLASKQLGMMKQGFTNQITIAVAPVLAEFAGMLPKLTFGAKGLADTLVNGMESVASSIAFVVDNWGDWNTLFAALGIGFDTFLAGVLEGFAQIADALPGIAEGMASLAGSLGRLIGGKKGEAFAAIGAQIYGEAIFGEGAKLGEGLRDKAKVRREQAAEDLFWLQAEQAAMAEEGLTQAGDAVTGFFGKVRDRMHAGGIQAGDGWMSGFYERFSKLAETTEGPLKAFWDKIGEVQALGKMASAAFIGGQLGGGMMGGWLGGQIQAGGLLPSADVLALGAFQAFQGLTGNLGKAQFAGAMEKGGKEAYSTELAYQEAGRINVQEQMRAALEMANKQREEQIKVGKEVLEAIQKGGLKVRGMD